jgi:phage terminase large subunit-like protein
VIQELQHDVEGLIEVTPEDGKIARAHAVSPQVEAGNIYLPHLPSSGGWKIFLRKQTPFPTAATMIRWTP